MLLGFLLFYVGAVLFLNGLWLMGKIEDREIVVINVVSGLVAGAVVVAEQVDDITEQGSLVQAHGLAHKGVVFIVERAHSSGSWG